MKRLLLILIIGLLLFACSKKYEPIPEPPPCYECEWLLYEDSVILTNIIHKTTCRWDVRDYEAENTGWYDGYGVPYYRIMKCERQ